MVVVLNVKCFHFKSVLKFFLGQIYHIEITYYIYLSFLTPNNYQLLMNKQENQIYAKQEGLKRCAKVFISAQNYLQFVNKKRLLAIYLQRKILFNLSF